MRAAFQTFDGVAVTFPLYVQHIFDLQNLKLIDQISLCLFVRAGISLEKNNL